MKKNKSFFVFMFAVVLLISFFNVGIISSYALENIPTLVNGQDDDDEDLLEWLDFTKIDLNFDMNIDTRDLSVLKKILLGKTTVEGLIGDINDDGKVDLVDLITFKRYLAGEQPIPDDGGEIIPPQTDEDKEEFVFLTYEEYIKLSPDEQQKYCESFESSLDFAEWFEAAKKEYEENNGNVGVGGNGNVNLDDILPKP